METVDHESDAGEERGVTGESGAKSKTTTTTTTEHEQREKPPAGGGDAQTAGEFDPSGGAGPGLQSAPEEDNPDVPAADRERREAAPEDGEE